MVVRWHIFETHVNYWPILAHAQFISSEKRIEQNHLLADISNMKFKEMNRKHNDSSARSFKLFGRNKNKTINERIARENLFIGYFCFLKLFSYKFSAKTKRFHCWISLNYIYIMHKCIGCNWMILARNGFNLMIKLSKRCAHSLKVQCILSVRSRWKMNFRCIDWVSAFKTE